MVAKKRITLDRRNVVDEILKNLSTDDDESDTDKN